jgi:hypothetical protein
MAIAELTSKKTKTQADNLEIGRLEFMGGLYVGRSGGLVIPAENVHKCIEETAKIRKWGKKVTRALLYDAEQEFQLQYEGPADLNELWEDKQFRFRTAVRVMGRRVMRTRARFHRWSLSTTWELLETQMNPKDLRTVVREAGIIEGLGDHRIKGSGRFEGKVIT